jgi:hypothetical protein
MLTMACQSQTVKSSTQRQRILKASIEEQQITFRGTSTRPTANFSAENL